MPEYFTPQEVAVMLKVRVKTVYKYIEDGDIPNVRRIRRSYRITLADIEELLARRRPTPNPLPAPPPPVGRRIISSGPR